MPMTPGSQAQDDLMLHHLREAVRLGYSMATPGSHDAVRDAFPDLFATEQDYAEVPTSDDLELDDHPMVSRGENGHWVSCWSWVEAPEPDEGLETCDACGCPIHGEVMGLLDGREVCRVCFEAGVG